MRQPKHYSWHITAESDGDLEEKLDSAFELILRDRDRVIVDTEYRVCMDGDTVVHFALIIYRESTPADKSSWIYAKDPV